MNLEKTEKNVTKEASYSKNCRDCWNHMVNVTHKLNKQYKHLKSDSCQICGVVTDKIELDHCHVTDKFRRFTAFSRDALIDDRERCRKMPCFCRQGLLLFESSSTIIGCV